MLGVSQAATVGINFQANYCGSPSISGYIVTTRAFGIDPSNWQNLLQMDTGYGSCSGPLFTNLSQVIDTTTSTDGLNPLPNGSLSISWGAPMANVSGFSGGYPGNRGEFQVYHGFLRDGVNFGPGSSGGDNNQPGYNIDITGLKSVFTNHPFAIQLIASSDSMKDFTNAFVIDATHSTTQSVVYPSPFLETPRSDTPWTRGYGGGLSTVTPIAIDADHIKIIGNRAAHGGDKTVPNDYNDASTIAGFIVTDQPVITMSPQNAVVCAADTVVWSGYAAGVPPLSYQWRKNGAAIPGATTSSLGLTNVSAGDFGSYDLVVTNLYGSAVSAAVSPDHLSIAEIDNDLVDSNTNGPSLDALNFGATWLATSGARSGVMSFAGASGNQIVVPGHTNLNSSVGAIMFWMHSGGLPVLGGNPAMLFDRRTGNGIVLAQTKDGQIQVQANPAAAQDFLSSNTSLSDGNWHHVALVFDQANGAQVTLYIDGVQDTASANGADWSWPAGQELEFGRSHDSFWQAYDGQMDDIRFYNRVLTAAEVLAITTVGTPLNNSGNVLRLNFNTAPVSGVALRWQCPEGILQSADPVNASFTDMTFAVSPYVTSFRSANKFYRYHGVRTPGVVIANPHLM